MNQVISNQILPIKLWLGDIEDGALAQAKNLANLPFAFRHIALMPDCHQGYGMPIGGVMATTGVIVPNAVGVDIGCGMAAIRTDLTSLTTEQLKLILGGSKERQGGICSNIPTGMSRFSKDQEWEGFDESYVHLPMAIDKHMSTARRQLGTLGGGNHFIEIQQADDGHIWIMIHSGSRHIGYQIAKYYNAMAQNLCSMWHSNIPTYKGEDGLAFLPLNTSEGQGYLAAMNFAMDYARASRAAMIETAKKAFLDVVDCTFGNILDVPHNYAALEHHFGKNVMVHRKGATSAKEMQLGIIPGSQGTKSYIVRGTGNPESFTSCSHGAGRTMSRNKAQKNLDMAEQVAILDDQNILHSIRNKKDLDEAPGAYKDIAVVMNNQKDLVDIVYELTPLAVVKG